MLGNGAGVSMQTIVDLSPRESIPILFRALSGLVVERMRLLPAHSAVSHALGCAAPLVRFALASIPITATQNTLRFLRLTSGRSVWFVQYAFNVMRIRFDDGDIFCNLRGMTRSEII